MSAIQDGVFIRSAFYKFGIHAKNIKDLISKFKSTQQQKNLQKLEQFDKKLQLVPDIPVG